MSYNIDDVDLIFDELSEKSDKTISNLDSELKSVRAGRANPHLLDKITVDYYGQATPINQMGTIAVPEARLIVISVWDKGALKNVEKAILAANIGVTPNNDGQVIRLVFPELNEERRKQIVKDIKNLLEETKVVLRNWRRDAIDQLKKIQKDSIITEDDLKNFSADVDKYLSKRTEEAEKLYKSKETEVLSI